MSYDPTKRSTREQLARRSRSPAPRAGPGNRPPFTRVRCYPGRVISETMSSGFPLDYLVEAIAELQVGRDARRRHLQDQEVSGDTVQSEIDEWNVEITRIRTLAIRVLEVELADLCTDRRPSTVKDVDPRPAERVLRPLVGAAIQRRLATREPPGVDTIFGER